MKGLTIGKINQRDFQLIMDSGEITYINEEFKVNFDGFFIQAERGEYTFVYGFYGAIPYLHKELFEVKAKY